jgi:putative hydrolase of the HAD superfamily
LDGKQGRKTGKEEYSEMQNEITAVIFDYGQVLAYSASREGFARMAKMFNVSFDEFRKLWETTRDVYDRGDLSPQEYWLMLAAKSNTSLDSDQIELLRKIEIEIWLNLDQAMLDWVRQLRAAGIKTGLLSNMPTDLATYLRANADWLDDFDFKTFSGEVRMIKPDPAIYQYTLRGLGVSAQQSLFVDDKEVNIRAARALGIHGIEFRSITQLKDELKALDFPVLPSDEAISTKRPEQGINLQL